MSLGAAVMPRETGTPPSADITGIAKPDGAPIDRRRAAPVYTRPRLRQLGLVDYEPVWQAMKRFTDERDATTPDEIWFLEHPPIFTLGMNADPAHVLAAGDIPVLRVDRGGQVTYHGPGQLVVYPLIDLKRAGIGVRDLVTAMEQSVIALAATFGIHADTQRRAPGVYVGERKLASVGIRVRRHSSYHGLALNVSVDLAPFTRINPCGFEGLRMIRLDELGGPGDVSIVSSALEPHLIAALHRACRPGEN